MSGNVSFSFCRLHLEDELDQYCKTCDCVLCNECIKANHGGHDWCRLRKVASHKRIEVTQKLKDIIRSYIPKVEDRLCEVKKVKEVNSNNLDENIKQIIDRGREIIAMANEVTTSLVKACQDRKMNPELRQLESDLDGDVRELQRMAEYFRVHEKDASDAEVMQLFKAFEDKQTDEIQHEPNNFADTLVFIPGHLDYPTLEYCFGYISDGSQKSETRSGSMESDIGYAALEEYSKFSFASDSVTTICVNSDKNSWIQSKFAKEIQLVTSDGSILSYVGVGEAIIRDFVRVDNGNLIMADSSNKVLKRWSAKDGSIKPVIHLAPFEPLGVNLSLRKELLVGLIDRSPFSLDHTTRKLVQRMSLNGKVIQTIEFEEGETKWLQYHMFNSPTKVAENYNADICVVDTISKVSGRLVVVKKSGKMKFTYEGQKLGRLFNPFDVCCSPNCEIFLSDPRNNSVHVLNANGGFLGLLVTDCKSPHALALQSDKLWVGSSSGFLYIYKYPSAYDLTKACSNIT